MAGTFNNPLNYDTPKEFDPENPPGAQNQLDQVRAGNEAHAGVDDLFRKLQAYSPVTIETADGQRLVVLAIQQGEGGPASGPFPLTIDYDDETSTATVTVGTVHLLNQDYIPEIKNKGIDTDPAPVSETIALGAPVYVRFELVPDAADDGNGNWEISGYSSVVGDEVTISGIKVEQDPVINPSDGTVLQNGKFSLLLGHTGVTPQNRYGPISVRACDSGLLAVSSPAYTFYQLPAEAE